MSSTLLSLVSLISCLFLTLHAYATPLDNIRQHQAIILQYHHVSDDTPPSTSVSPDTFIAHLELIEALEFEVKPLNDVIESIRSQTPFKKKTLAITFDDGYESIYDSAYPQLKQRQWPFTVFVSPQAIDEQHGSTMTWEQLKEIQKQGATIANHSYQHLHLLARLDNENEQQWAQRIRNDIQMTQTRLEKELGVTLKYLAYPYGEFDDALKDILKELDYIGLAQQSGGINRYSDFQALPRFPASGIYANVKTLKTKLNSLVFPVIRYSPAHKVRLAGQPAPKLTLVSQAHDIQYQQSQCFYAGQPIATQTSVSNNELTIEAQFNGNLTPGRSRYNCTAPSKSAQGYYWFSMPFIVLGHNQQWID